MRSGILLLIVWGILMLSSRALPAEEPSDSGFCRFWRGFRKDGSSAAEFQKRLATEFMPATVATPGKFGLRAYLVVLPPEDHPAFVPDEIALVIYGSEAKYREMNSNPEGKKYQESHWDVFQRGPSGSLVPQPFSGSVGELPEKGLAFDLLEKPVDWQAGHSLFIMSFRRPGIGTSDFGNNISMYIRSMRAAFPACGLRGCLVLVTDQSVMTFMNWESRDAMESAAASPDGKAIARAAGKILETHMQATAREFDGTIRSGEFVRVKL